MASYVVNTAAGMAIITVDRDGGGGVVTVSYSASGGTAVPGVDYTPISGMLTFSEGDDGRDLHGSDHLRRFASNRQNGQPRPLFTQLSERCWSRLAPRS